MPRRRSWRDSVAAAVTRVIRRSGRRTFSRRELIEDELARIVEVTRSGGCTPHQTLSRVLQELRDDGQIEFLDPGEYRAVADTVR
jgi:hypothetical protein